MAAMQAIDRMHQSGPLDDSLLFEERMPSPVLPTIEAARARIAAFRPAAYAATRNAINGAVSGLSPYITHGFVTMNDVLGGVTERYTLDVSDRFVYELGWRAYFHHIWHHRGSDILRSLHAGALPDLAYLREMPKDIRCGCTGVPVIDTAVRQLYETGTLHNHARMWLASYTVHVRKVHWRVGADWLYAHLLDGDIASNHLSWQWVAGTGSKKPYLFNAENVAKYAPASWHSYGSILDTSYEDLDSMARTLAPSQAIERCDWPEPSVDTEPVLMMKPPEQFGVAAPDASAVDGREVWLVHPWSLGALPENLPQDVIIVGLLLQDFHRAWPWDKRRWHFVCSRMTALADVIWCGDAASCATALASARRVRSIFEPHLTPWLPDLADCVPKAMLFPQIDSPCASFSQWWKRASRGLRSATDLLMDKPIVEW